VGCQNVDLRPLDLSLKFAIISGASEGGKYMPHNDILEPNVEIPVCEKWLFDNKVALKKVEAGITDAAKGKISKCGSFAKYVGDNKK